MLTVILSVLCSLIIVEMNLRYYFFRCRPLRIKLAYSFFMLSSKMIIENEALVQRIMRGGFSNEKELFEHYEKISGKPYNQIKDKFGCGEKLPSICRRGYYSGGHGVIERVQKMHLGFTPKPEQILRTLEIDETGWRKTGYDLETDEIQEGEKLVVLLGDSTIFGIGATSDSNTIAGRIGFYLNLGKESDRKLKFYVIT